MVTTLIAKLEMVEAPDIRRKKIQVPQTIAITIYCRDHTNRKREMQVEIVEIWLLWIINPLERNTFTGKVM